MCRSPSAPTLTKGCDSGEVIDVPVDRFEELVAEALDGIPDELGRLIDNVAVFVRKETATRTCSVSTKASRSRASGNYGLGMAMPDRITVYRQPILMRCNTEDDVIHMVRITVVHEIGHHFGIDDRRLHELGYG